ncbi:RICIN domain-containing protein [Kitasatospora sp. NPDC094019]|uniref:RICIN domain-containing protein n=1 Tax=Kitasatospora sp. NPDC094019 TaxID=3364091 RepID=UPI003824E11C
MKRSLSIPARLLALVGAALLALVVAAPPANAYVLKYRVWIINDATSTTTARCLDVPGDSAPWPGDRVGVFQCTPGDNQIWDLIGTGSFDYTYPNGAVTQLDRFVVQSSLSTYLCLDVPGTGGDLPNGTEIRLHGCITAHDNQEWYWLPWPTKDSGDKLLVNYRTGKCLDIDGVAADGTDTGNRTTWLYDCIVPGGGTDDHLWHTL